jgi:hypothetical protein
MNVPWWVWLIGLLYAAPGIYGFVTMLRMKPIGGLPEDDVPRQRPWPKWIGLPLGFVLLVVCWPAILWLEWRHARSS